MTSQRDASTVLNPSAPDAEVARAARQVSDDDVSAEVWAMIANDSAYSEAHRRVCALELFRRHVHAGSTVAEVARLLNRPTWLLDEHIRELEDISGRVPPVALNGMDSVFAIDLLPGPPPVTILWSVYLRIGGQVDRDALSACLRGHPAGVAGAAVVVEIGFLPS